MKKIQKNDWVMIKDTKNRHFNTEGMVLGVKKGKIEVELDEGYGSSIFRTFKKKQLKKVRC